MRIDVNVDAEDLEKEIKEIMKEAGETLYDYSRHPNLSTILIWAENINSTELKKKQENQKRISDFLKNKKGIFGGVFLIIFLVIILFLIIIIALLR